MRFVGLVLVILLSGCPATLDRQYVAADRMFFDVVDAPIRAFATVPDSLSMAGECPACSRWIPSPDESMAWGILLDGKAQSLRSAEALIEELE